MGMDLKPIAPTKEAPRHPADDEYSPSEPVWGRYNWSGWRLQIDLLLKWGADPTALGFAGSNDGQIIPAWACKKVADLIEANLHTLDEETREWLRPKIILWRTCGGYRQF